MNRHAGRRSDVSTDAEDKSLRALIAGPLGSDYRPNQMTYDLRRLRLA